MQTQKRSKGNEHAILREEKEENQDFKTSWEEFSPRHKRKIYENEVCKVTILFCSSN